MACAASAAAAPATAPPSCSRLGSIPSTPSLRPSPLLSLHPSHPPRHRVWGADRRRGGGRRRTLLAPPRAPGCDAGGGGGRHSLRPAAHEGAGCCCCCCCVCSSSAVFGAAASEVLPSPGLFTDARHPPHPPTRTYPHPPCRACPATAALPPSPSTPPRCSPLRSSSPGQPQHSTTHALRVGRGWHGGLGACGGEGLGA